MELFDVIVIGGSVSGAPTAMLLSRLGYRVLLLEKKRFPRDTNSTHFIWPRGVSYLNRWGLLDKIFSVTPHYKKLEINIEGISLVGSIPLVDLKERFKQLHGSDHGVVDYYCGPRRYFLDTHLLNAAREAGVDVREETSYVNTIFDNQRVVGVLAQNKSGKKFVAHAKLVIGADGRFSSFAKEVGANFKDYRALSSFAYYGYFTGINRHELAIHKKGRLGTAIFPTLDDTQMVLVYGPTAWWDAFKKGAEKNFLNIFRFCAPDIAALIEQGRRVENFKACARMEAFQRELHGAGWALIGDASSFKDQITAMGITHSFRDAELISSFIHRALQHEMSMEEALSQYESIRKTDYTDYFDLVCKTAEMNAYSKEELMYFYNIKENPLMIDQMISQFGDTLPVSSGVKLMLPDERNWPDFIKNYQVEDGSFALSVF